jgi:hypothetical protein
VDEGQDGDGTARFLDEERRLTGLLDGLSPAARTALAASVADRLLPHFRRFHERTGRGEPRVLESALDGVWDQLACGSAFDIVAVALACSEQGSVAAELTHVHAGTSPTSPQDAYSTAALTAESALEAALAVAGACYVAVHGRVRETLHCLQNGRVAAAVSARSGLPVAQRSRPVAEGHPMVEQEKRLQLRDLELLERSGTTARVLAELRTPRDM